jgi:hypothetical protein
MTPSPLLGLRSFANSATLVGVLLVALTMGGCSAVRLGYNNSPALVYWWLDSYFDFDEAQSQRVRSDLQALQDWHRTEEVPLLAQMLQELQTMARKEVSPDQVCAIVADLQTRLQVTLERAIPTIAAIAPELKSAQLGYMSQEYEQRNRKWQEIWIAGTLAERSERRLKQLEERIEPFYGNLNDAQMALVRAYIANSSFDGPRQLQEAKRRQKDNLQVLTKIRTGEIPPNQAVLQVRGLLEQTLKAPEPAYRRYMEQLTFEGCTAMATLHNSITPEQRTRLAQVLRGYEDDARALAAQR